MADRGHGVGERHWAAEVVVLPKPGVNDPEGDAILGGLRQLGYAGVEGVRAGRLFELFVSASDAAAAEGIVGAMCDRLLANPVIETYRVSVRERIGPPDRDVTGDTPDSEGTP